MISKERRRHHRVPVRINAGVFAKDKPGEFFPAEILDLSLGGAFVHCPCPIRTGQEIFLEIRFDETQLVEAKVVIANEVMAENLPNSISEKVVVRWARGASSDGFGVAFVSLNGEKREFIAKMMAYFESLKKSGVQLPSR